MRTAPLVRIEALDVGPQYRLNDLAEWPAIDRLEGLTACIYGLGKPGSPWPFYVGETEGHVLQRVLQHLTGIWSTGKACQKKTAVLRSALEAGGLGLFILAHGPLSRAERRMYEGLWVRSLREAAVPLVNVNPPAGILFAPELIRGRVVPPILPSVGGTA